MDYTFISVTFVFIVILLASHYLDVLKLSTPIVLIYLIYCFSHIIDNDIKKDHGSVISHNNDIYKTDEIDSLIKIKNVDGDNNDAEDRDISKPVVSYNPKPIVIDSNLMIQKDKVNASVDSSVKFENNISLPWL